MHSFEDDKELDQYSRSAAEAYEAPSPADWDQMQRVLDRELPQQEKRKRGIIWWMLPILLTAALGFFWIFDVSNKTALKTITKTENKINNTQSNPTTITDHTGLATDGPTNLEVNKPTPKFSKQTYPTGKQFFKESNEIAITTNKTEIPVAPSKEPAIQNSNEQCCAVQPTISEIKKEAFSANLSSTLKTDAATAPTTETSNMVATNSLPKKKHTDKGFFIGLTGGFDASTVNYAYASSVGYNIGGSLGYRFNKHWSVQTGAIYTRKNYKLKGEDFHAPKGSWISYYNIETVDGFCKMWDIPVMATYHFNGNDNGNSFVSVGTSSYFMKNENYNYLYYYNNQQYRRSSNYNSNNQHLFALLHLSAGIERPIGKSFSSIIETYAKIPFAGVGFGSIQLSSFGLNFSVQYRQPKK